MMIHRCAPKVFYGFVESKHIGGGRTITLGPVCPVNRPTVAGMTRYSPAGNKTNIRFGFKRKRLRYKRFAPNPWTGAGADRGEKVGAGMIGEAGLRRGAKGCLSLFGTTALLLVTAGPADAAGFYLQEQSVR